MKIDLNALKLKMRNSVFLRKLYAAYQSRGNSKQVRGSNNRIDVSQATLQDCQIIITGNGNTVLIGKGAFLKSVRLVLKGNHLQLKIGEKVSIGSNSTLWMEDDNGILEIGNYCSFEQVDMAVAEDNTTVHIGEDCMFAYGIDVRCSDSHAMYDRHTRNRINYAGDIKIGDHVWVGAKTLILKGVSVGDGSVIGAGSIVTRSVPKHSVAAGIPAHIIRNDIVWTRARGESYLESTKNEDFLRSPQNSAVSHHNDKRRAKNETHK